MLGILADGDKGAQAAGADHVAAYVKVGQVGNIPVGHADALRLVILKHGDRPLAVDQHPGGAQAEELEPVHILGAHLGQAHMALIHVYRGVPDRHPFLEGGEIVVQQVGIALVHGQRRTQPVRQETAPVLGAVLFKGQLAGQIQVLVPRDLCGIGNPLLIEEVLIVVQGVQGAAVGDAVIIAVIGQIAHDRAKHAQVDAGRVDVGF